MSSSDSQKNAAQVPKHRIGDGPEMLQIGFGTGGIGPDQTQACVEAAIEVGYRHIDCAAVYGNQKEVGLAIQSAIKKGLIKDRSELWLTSKVWNTEHGQQGVKHSIEQTLKDLQTDYVDLLHVHFPLAWESIEPRPDVPTFWTKQASVPDEQGYPKSARVPLHVTWAAMEEVQQSGKAKHIGIANYTAPLIADLLTYCKIKPAVLQVELHAYNSQSALEDYAVSQGIAVTAYAPLGKPSVKLGEGIPPLFEHQTITKIVSDLRKQHNRQDIGPEHVLVNWHVAHGRHAVPRSSKPERVKSNFVGALGYKLSAEQVKAIDELDIHLRIYNQRLGGTQKNDTYDPAKLVRPALYE